MGGGGGGWVRQQVSWKRKARKGKEREEVSEKLKSLIKQTKLKRKLK